LIHSQQQAGSDEENDDLFTSLYICLDISVYLSEKSRPLPHDTILPELTISQLFYLSIDLLDSALPMMLIEDLMDVLTIGGTSRLFEYIESRVERLTANMDPSRGKGLVLLRFCNELLRRLSKAQNKVFCGRILIFLTSVYPLTERSGERGPAVTVAFTLASRKLNYLLTPYEIRRELAWWFQCWECDAFRRYPSGK
jgi:hypothetical protein